MDYQPVKTGIFRRRKSRTEKILCGLLLLVLLLAITLGIFLAYTLFKGEEKVCKTPECIKASHEILQKMDMNVNPCDDFFEFSCGNFVKKTVIPPSKTLVDSFSSLTKVIDKQIHAVLEEPISSEDPKPVQLVKKLYNACMNETDIELSSLPSIKNLFRNLGGWPVVEGRNWNERDFNWYQTLLALKDRGMLYNIFMDFKVELDNKNSSRRVLTIDQPFVAFEAAKRGPKNSKILNASYTFMKNVAEEFGADSYSAEIEMREVLNFEIELVKIMVPQEERRDLAEEYNPISLRHLESDYPILPWHSFVKSLTAPAEISYDENLIVYLPEYLRNLQFLLQRTPRRVLANYIFYKSAGSMIAYSNKKLRELQLDFMKTTLGIASSRPRIEQCTSVASRLEVAAGAVYVRKYFDKNSKTYTEEIVKNIEDEFANTLKKIDWMDEVTKTAALEKLKFMGKYVGYPDELMDDQKLEEYYKELDFSTDNYINIILKVSKFQTLSDMKQLNEPVVKTDWRNRANVAIVNAFYDLNGNAIQVPAGILQGVFFNAKRPHYLNYGGIGYIVGHEFTHGFDDEGSQMDKDGNLREWWKNETKAAYDQKAECIVEQYSKIVVPEVNMTINGINTQGENIADNGGIKLAYQAYQEWTSRNELEPKLPGLDYNPNQMFWIGTASAWCSKIKMEELEQEILSEVHPPDKYRINVPFANSGFFAKDFNCPEGSNMNPAKTCTVW